jgi:hypothetical protein
VEVIDFNSKKLPDEDIERQLLKAPTKKPKMFYPNKALMQWIWAYFNDRKDLPFIPPLYLQYDGIALTPSTGFSNCHVLGHSLTVVGCVRDAKNNIDIILFDPSVWSRKLKLKLEAGEVPAKLKRTIRGISRDKYQIGFISSTKLQPADYTTAHRTFKTTTVNSE